MPTYVATNLNANLVDINANTLSKCQIFPIVQHISPMAIDINSNTLTSTSHLGNASYPTIFPFGIDGNTSSCLRIDGQSLYFFYTSPSMSHQWLSLLCMIHHSFSDKLLSPIDISGKGIQDIFLPHAITHSMIEGLTANVHSTL